MIIIKRPVQYVGMLCKYHVTIDDDMFKLKVGGSHTYSILRGDDMHMDVSTCGALGSFKIKDVQNLKGLELKTNSFGSNLVCNATYNDGRVVCVPNKKEGQNRSNANIMLLVGALLFAFMCFKGFHFGYR